MWLVQQHLVAWVAIALLPLTSAFGISALGTLESRGSPLLLPATPSPARLLPRRQCSSGALQLQADMPALFLAAAAQARATFEAQPPPFGTTLAVLGSTGGVLAYWWLVLVPSERRDLAKAKNKVLSAGVSNTKTPRSPTNM